MAAKNQSSQASYQPLPRDDPSAALLSPSERDDRDNGRSPIFSITFSPITILRLIVVAIIIANIVFLCMTRRVPGVAAVFTIGSIFLIIWHAYCVFKNFLPSRKGDNKFDLKIGSFFCTFGTTSSSSRASNATLSYLAGAVDFCFGLFFIGPSVLAIHDDIWPYNGNVAGMSITIVVLQAALPVLNLFSVLRKLKIFVERGEEDDHHYSIPEPFRDDVSEPRDSMSSEV